MSHTLGSDESYNLCDEVLESTAGGKVTGEEVMVVPGGII